MSLASPAIPEDPMLTPSRAALLGLSHLPLAACIIANSILFTKEQWGVVVMSNIGILSMVAIVRLACATWGAASVIRLYGIPWLCVTHW